MAHSIQTQVLVDGPRKTIIKVTIKGDGASAELTNQVIFDAAAYTPAVTTNALMDITYELTGFSAELLWDATANVPLISLALDHPHHECFYGEAGLVNNAGAGVTGDILITTTGLNASTKAGYIIFNIRKRKVPATL